MLQVIYDDAKFAKVMQGGLAHRRGASEEEAMLWDAQFATYCLDHGWHHLGLNKDQVDCDRGKGLIDKLDIGLEF